MLRRPLQVGLLAMFVAAACLTAGALHASELTVFPQRLDFNQSSDRQQLLVTIDGRDATRRAEYRSTNDAAVSVDACGFAAPQGDGEGAIAVRCDGQEVVVPFVVMGFDRPRRVDFDNEVVPLLSRYGCNAGGCHGKASGQNGFKLSLFGFDAEYDYQAVVEHARGRRIFPAAPERSLLLRKATGAVSHGGGKRLDETDEGYKTILAWIRSGAPPSADDLPHVVRLTLTPSERILRPGESQQLAATAEFSDGSVRDVTRAASYSSNLDVVAAVDEQGFVATGDQRGEATIMARYMGQVAAFRAIAPHGEPLAEIPEFQPLTEIDRIAAEKWRKLGLRPSPGCDDATFLRRVTLDVCGRLPTVEETRAFLKDDSPDKRTRLVDRLLESPDYAAFFALRWSVILRNSRLAGADQAAYAFHNWIKDSIAQNRPYDDFVRGIVAASGEWQDAPAINWYWQSRDDQLHQVTADTAQLFLGVRLQCARCHHHPYERWGQEDYYGLAGFFTRLGRKSFGQPPPYFASPTVTTGEKNPLTGATPEPKYLDGPYAEFTPEDDPRHALVDWMAQPDNPFFSRALVNRLWGHFFGRGLVHEVDDMRATNPPSNPELLDYLARDFVESGFDMKHTVRRILTSRIYQLSSAPTADNEDDRQNFARYYARRMYAEVLLDAVDQACGAKTQFNGVSATAGAVDLPHEGFGSYFLDAFDRPKRVTVCECERSPGATLAQVLLLANSDEVENKIASGQGRITKACDAQKPTTEIIEELYLAAYARRPTEEERAKTVQFVESAGASRPEREAALQDVLWTLLNSREFLFNR